MIRLLMRGGLVGSPFFVFLPLLSSPLEAQAVPWGSLAIDHFGLEEGLPGLFVPDLAVTGDGRLWMLSSGAVTSFDGLEFERHQFAGAGSLSNGDVTGIGAGRGDTLWVSARRELHSLVAGQTRLRAEHTRFLRNVWQDAEGQLWVMDDAGLLRLGPGGFERVVQLSADRSRRLLPVGGDALPGGEARLGLVDSRMGTSVHIAADGVVGPLPLLDAWPVPRDDHGYFLTRTGPDSVEVTDVRGERLAIIPRFPARTPVLADRRGLVWTERLGRMEVLGRQGDVLASFEMAPDARVNAVVEDREGNVWIGTVTDGLYRISVRPVRVLAGAEGVTDGQVQRVSAGPDGSVLVLDDLGRITRVAGTRVDTIFEPTLEGRAAVGAVADRQGTIWISWLDPSGLWLSGRTPQGREIQLALPALRTSRIVEDPLEDGLLWLVGAGVYRVRPYAESPQIDGPLLDRTWRARDLVVDGDGAAWVAGPLGVARVSAERIEEFRADEGFPTGNARALHLDEAGTLWIGTYQQGVVRYRDGEFSVVRAVDGLWDDVVSSMLEDEAGNLWMGSNRGVHRIARSELNAFIDGESDRVRGRGYDSTDGFRNAEASGWPAHKSRDGTMWFPTFSGVAVISPEAVIASERVPPHVRLRTVRAGETVFEAGDSLRLERGQRRVGLAYGATLLSGHDEVWYEVLMEGVDPDWVDVGNERSVTYAALPPGRRTFRVRARRQGVGPGSTEASITLGVPAYFRETAAFYLILSMVAALTLAAAYSLRMRQLRAREENLKQLVQDRTADLQRSQARTEEALATVQAQAAELRSVDEAKSRFFANVSHELRTPLTLVQGPLMDVLHGRLGYTSDAVKEQVEVVLGSGRRLGELVEQLLDVARLEASEFRLSMVQQDLTPLLHRLGSSFGALARSRGIGFETELPDGVLMAVVDADQIEKVYGNILANALKFTPEGGRVRFVVEVLGEELVVSVQDDGPGIPEAERERIFERFHQVDSSSRRPYAGAGLGLALVKEVTELHGGRVEFSVPREGGSRFTVSTPVDGPSGWTGEATAHDLVPLRTATSEKGEAAGGDDDSERPTVLVVEDDEELRAYLRRHLESDYRVIEAPNGQKGLEEARRTVPDLILCDVMMPVMDGEDLCRAIRSDPELDFLPVVMVTARAARESRISALEGGADDYLVKPFDPEELRLRVDNLLAARRRLRERFLEDGRALSYAGLDLPVAKGHENFAEQVEAVLRQRMDDEDLEPEAIAKALLMSRATLYRRTEEALGASPMELLWSLRLRQAAQWLQETDATVSEVAYACGFKTVPHFTRRFKQRFSSTPAAYRREQQDPR